MYLQQYHILHPLFLNDSEAVFRCSSEDLFAEVGQVLSLGVVARCVFKLLSRIERETRELTSCLEWEKPEIKDFEKNISKDDFLTESRRVHKP